MKYFKFCILSLFISLAFVTTTYGSTVQVNWVEPDKYRDIDSGVSPRKRFKDRVFKALETKFNELATNLPDNYVMKISVTDIDLAGDVKYIRNTHIRVVSDLYFPRINLTYEIMDNNNKLQKTADVRIKKMNFLSEITSVGRNNDFLYHEGKMIDEWFNKTFTEYLVQN